MAGTGTSLNSNAMRRRARRYAGVANVSSLSLRDLRKNSALTQQRLARALGIGQDSVSRLEQRRDLRVSTLRAYIEALGGRLVLLAEFPGQECVVIRGLEREVSTAANDPDGTNHDVSRRRRQSITR